MALRRASRFYRVRSATFTLVLLCGLSVATGACGTLLGAEDEYVVGAPAGEGGAGLGGSAPNAGASAGAGGPGQGGAGASPSGGNAGSASGQAGSSAGQAGQAGQGGANASGAGGIASGAGGIAGGGAAGSSTGAGFGGTTTTGGFGGTSVAGSGGASGAGTAGNMGTGGANAGSSQGGTSGGSSQGGSAGSSVGGAAGSSGGNGGSSAGKAGSSGASGGSAGSNGGSGGATGGSGGAGGAADPCCLTELSTFTAKLVTEYEQASPTLFDKFTYAPPVGSACYDYLVPTENTSSLIRFAAQSKVFGCENLAVEVAAVAAKGSGRNAVGGACVTSNVTNATVNAAVGYCSAAQKIVCNTKIVQGEAIGTAACTEATCTSCLTAGTASVKAWLKAQDDYYTANNKFDVTMAPPTDTSCYDYTFVYKDPSVVKLAAAAKNVACTSLAGRTDGKPATAVPAAAAVITSGICASPTNASFSAFVTETWGVVGDCERANKGPATIACEVGATPVAGTGAVARSACGPE